MLEIRKLIAAVTTNESKNIWNHMVILMEREFTYTYSNKSILKTKKNGSNKIEFLKVI